MLTLKEYKSKVIDRTGKATAALINTNGETFLVGDAYVVTHLNSSKLKMGWKCPEIPEQWYPYTHVAFYNQERVETITEIPPINLWQEPVKKLHLVFDYD